MREARLFIALMGLALTVGCASTAAPTPAISKTNARATPEADLKEIVLAQLGDILVEYPRPTTGKKPKHPLTDLRYWTVPQSGSWPNICRFQILQFEFSPIGRAGKNADALMRVSGLSADKRYFVTGAVERDRSDEIDRDRAPFDRACAAHAPSSVNGFPADGEDQIVTVVSWLQEINAMSDEAFSSIEVSCDIRRDSPLSDCGAAVRNSTAGSIAGIRDCTRDRRDIREPYCIQVDFPLLSVEFTARPGDALPSRIVAREIVYFADQRID